ncbi:MAG: YggT family protein [Syntrophobacteraceae bacterium]|nr:YggT family protein [Syntrophobacteraceae bacterium]
MFIVANLLFALAKILGLALNIYMWIVIARAILSWVNPDPYNPIVRFLYNATEPVLYAIRRRMPLAFGGIDFSPVVLILGLIFLDYFLVASLGGLAVRLSM